MRSLTATTPRHRHDLSISPAPPDLPSCMPAASPSPTTSTLPSLATAIWPPPVLSTAVSTTDTSKSPSQPGVVDLAAENIHLKERILHLEEERSAILNHSIESDTRLMQYTNEVFVAGAPKVDSLVRASATDCAVQCNLITHCTDERCAESRALTVSLKTTIEVLEAELQCLRSEREDCECGKQMSQSNSKWVKVGKKNKPTISVNRYKAPASPTEDVPLPQQRLEIPQQAIKKPTRRKKRVNHLHPNIQQKVALTFPLIQIEGDSHSRDLAELLRKRISDETVVTGDCKPGGKLLNTVSTKPPPPGSCSIIIAGTNDLADGQQSNVYRYIEGRISAKLETSRVIVCTLPYRHDLPPSHPIHLETALTNAYIEELGARRRGVEVVDFNRIDRRAFSRHGMHLKPHCKRLLADLLIESLRGLDEMLPSPPPLTTEAQPPVPVPTCGALRSVCELPAMADAEPHMLRYDTFAAAVKSPTPKSEQVPSTQKNLCLSPIINQG